MLPVTPRAYDLLYPSVALEQDRLRLAGVQNGLQMTSTPSALENTQNGESLLF